MRTNQGLTDEFLLDDTEKFVLLQCFTGNVERKVVTVHDTLQSGLLVNSHDFIGKIPLSDVTMSN